MPGMISVGATQKSRRILISLLTGLLTMVFASPALAQEPAGADQYIPAVPGVPSGGGGGSGDGDCKLNSHSEARPSSQCNEVDQGDVLGLDDSDDVENAGGSGPPANDGGPPTAEASAGSSLPFTGYPLDQLSLIVLALLVAGALLRLGLAAHDRRQRPTAQL